jgi:putative aldouronate transport system substrate-binding protein
MAKPVRVLAWAVGLLCLATVATWATGKPEGENQAVVVQQPVKLTVELFDRNNAYPEGQSLQDNRWTKWIKGEMLKRGIEVIYIPVPRSDEKEKVNVLMAAGSAPDILFTYDRLLLTKFATDGGLNDLTGALAKYGANLKTILGTTTLDYGKLQGKQYAIPAIRVDTAHRTEWIRKDWLDKLGLAVPKNRDELVSVLKAFKQKDPGGIGADRVIPWGDLDQKTNSYEPHNFRLFNAMYSFFDNDRKKMYTTPSPLREGFKEFMAWLNSMYKANLLDKEFATDTDQLLYQKIINNQVGFFADSWWSPYTVTYGDWVRNLLKSVPTANYVPLETFCNKDGRYLKIAYPPVGLYNMSPATSKVTETAVKYMDWMAQKDVSFALTFGIEGEHYKLQDGVPLPIDVTYNAKSRIMVNDLTIILNGYPLPAETADKRTLLEYGDIGKPALASRTMAVRDSFPEVLFNEEIKSWSKYGPEIVKTWDEYWVKLIITDSFEATYTDFMSQLKARNIDEVVKERTAYYEKNF